MIARKPQILMLSLAVATVLAACAKKEDAAPAADTAAMTARAYQPPPAPLSSPNGSFMALNAAWAAKPGRMLPVRLAPYWPDC